MKPLENFNKRKFANKNKFKTKNEKKAKWCRIENNNFKRRSKKSFRQCSKELINELIIEFYCCKY